MARAGSAVMTQTRPPIGFLFDVDNTLLHNDCVLFR